MTAGQVRQRLRLPWVWALDHPVLAVFLAAGLLRVGVAAGVLVVSGGTLLLDDASYVHLAEQVAAGNRAAAESSLFTSTLVFLGPVAGLFAVFGPHVFLAQLYVVLFGAVAAAAVAAVALRLATPRAALSSGLLVAVLPSQVFWSSLVMKDVLVWACLALIAVVLTRLDERRGRRLLASALGLVVLLVALRYLRGHTFVIACWAAAAGLVLRHAGWDLARLGAAVLLLVFLPWSVGFGPAGHRVITGVESLEDVRCAYAYGGQATVVDTDDCTVVIDESGQPRGASIEQRPIGLGHLPRGLSVMLLEPFPWQQQGSTALRIAAFESLLWYPLLVLAVVGLVRNRRHWRMLAYPVLVGGAVLLAYALVQGNLGTAYRHRGEFVWVVALFAGLGLEALIERRSASSRAGTG